MGLSALRRLPVIADAVGDRSDLDVVCMLAPGTKGVLPGRI